MNNDMYKQALNYCLRLLLRRDYTIAEIEKKIIAKGYTKVISKSVVEQLIIWGYLNDKKYTTNYISSGINKGQSKRKIYYALLAKGIAKDIINDAIYQLFNDEIEYQQLNKIATKKLNNIIKRAPAYAVHNKLYLYLVSKGFSTHTVKAWIEANIQAFLDNNANKL